MKVYGTGKCEMCGKRFKLGAYFIPHKRVNAEGKIIYLGSECVKKFDAQEIKEEKPK